MAIPKFSREHAYLSNFSDHITPYILTLPDGTKHKRNFLTSEHAYQASKHAPLRI